MKLFLLTHFPIVEWTWIYLRLSFLGRSAKNREQHESFALHCRDVGCGFRCRCRHEPGHRYARESSLAVFVVAGGDRASQLLHATFDAFFRNSAENSSSSVLDPELWQHSVQPGLWTHNCKFDNFATKKSWNARLSIFQRFRLRLQFVMATQLRATRS